MAVTRNYKKIFKYCGLGSSIMACVFMLISFSTSYWIERHEDGQKNFVSTGLWEVCYNGWKNPFITSMKIYRGCWWIFSDHLRPMREYILPSWFISVQVMISVTLLCQALVVIFLLSLLVRCCPHQMESILLMISSIMMFLCGLLIAISLIVFGVMSEDRQWMPRPDQNFLSWSFGICVMSGFFSLFGAMCLLVASISASAERSTAPSMSMAMKTRY